jgi:hypothetical protein
VRVTSVLTAGRPFRALAAALAAAALAGSVGGCTREEPPPEPETPRPSAAFSSEFTRTQDGLRWSYRLRNREGAALIAFNGPDADYPDEGPAIWVTRRDDRTVEVAQRLLAPPEDAGPARPILVHGSIVPPGVEISGTAEVALPLAVRHPYRDAFEPALRLPSDAEEVVFCLGVAREREFVPMPTDPADRSPAAEPSAPPPGPRYAHLAGSLLRQHLFCAPPQPLQPS